MKNNMEELRKLKDAELQKKMEDSKEELFNLRISQATGSLEKPSRIKELRKIVARIKTIQHERALKN